MFSGSSEQRPWKGAPRRACVLECGGSAPLSTQPRSPNSDTTLAHSKTFGFLLLLLSWAKVLPNVPAAEPAAPHYNVRNYEVRGVADLSTKIADSIFSRYTG